MLVVDDNVDAAMTLAEAVRLDGHEVRVAHDGVAALEDAAAFAPEVVLLDIGLPGMDGYEVARRAAQQPQLRADAAGGADRTTARRPTAERARRPASTTHLVKPVDLDTVHGVLRRRLG